MFNDKPTSRQIQLINKIKQALKIPFTGKTKKEASDYISENINAYNLFKDTHLSLSQKQQDFISKAVLDFNEPFECKNNQEASIWISNMMRRYREKNQKSNNSNTITLD